MLLSSAPKKMIRGHPIKHSGEIVPEQMRHLLDEEKCKAAKHRFGPITGKYVIYRGPESAVEGVRYLDVEKYLCGLRAGQK